MKKKYVKPEFTYISNLSQLEAIRQWDKPNSIEYSKNVVEVAYIACEQEQHSSACRRQNN